VPDSAIMNEWVLARLPSGPLSNWTKDQVSRIRIISQGKPIYAADVRSEGFSENAVYLARYDTVLNIEPMTALNQMVHTQVSTCFPTGITAKLLNSLFVGLVSTAVLS